MRRIILLLVLFAITGGLVNAQLQLGQKKLPKKRCGTMEYMAKLEAADPSMAIRREQLEEYTQNWIKNNPDHMNKAVITIPVVFHIVYKTTAQNVSDQRVAEALAQLNRDFSGQNPHSMGAFNANLKANANFQFCMAQRKPDGTATNGIVRVSTTTTTFSTDDKVKSSSTGGDNAWDVTKYLNIWVCNLGNMLLGYGQFPYANYTTSGTGIGANINNTYGLVIHYAYFGSTGATAPFNDGGTSTHEIGHCFNLFHIWGDDGSACSGSDYCGDTPNQASETYGSPSGVKTDACATTSPGVMYMNFMDYSDDGVMCNFTPNQVARMQALFASGGPLFSLTQSNGCTPVGGTQLATVTTTAASAITNTTATSGGNVTADGGATVTARGVCWATTQNPTTTNSKTTDGSGTGTFTSSLTGLTANTTYYVRAYATNSVGTAYGNQITFTTTNSTTQAPTVTTNTVSNITASAATCGGNVTSAGSATVTARGVCWATTQNPTTANSKTTDGSGTGTFTSSITGLSANTTYYVRAYATNSVGTSYGAQQQFQTTGGSSSGCSELANVTATDTLALYSLGTWGYLPGHNSYSIPAYADKFTNTTAGTISKVYFYTIMAHAGNASHQVTFKVYNGSTGTPGTELASKAVNINTLTPNSIDSVVFTTPASVTGDFFVGFELSYAAPQDTFAVACVSDRGASGINTAYLKYNNAWSSFPSLLSGLNSSIAVFPVLCTTSSVTVPTVTTTAASAIQTTTATSGGNVTADGGATVTARGVCWATTANPTIANSKTTDGSGTGTFTSSLTGLSPNTTYNIRAYATNSAGTAYGQNLTFTTAQQTTGYTIYGTLVYNNTANTPMNGVTMTLMNGATQVATATSNTSGAFAFTNVANGTYTVNGATTSAWGGVTSTDVLKIKRHIAGLELLTEPIRLTGADVNNSANITSTDALKVSRRLAGLEATFTRPDWIFELQSTGGNTVTVNGATVQKSFYALCTGDVNGTNVPALFMREKNIDTEISGKINISGSNVFSIPVTINSKQTIGAIQLTVNYPQSQFEIVDVTTANGNEELVFNAENGVLNINWSSLNSLQLNSNDAVVSIKVRPVSSGSYSLSFAGINEIADGEGNILNNVRLSSPAIEVGDLQNENIINVYPNPSQNIVNVDLGKFNSDEVKISVVSIIGKQVSLRSKSTNSLVSFDFSDLANGIYFIHVNTPDGTSVKSVSISK